jgi:hypothetical protein
VTGQGAGCIRRLPLLRTGLLVIGGLYTLRGLMLIPGSLIALGLVQASESAPPQELFASLVALSIGVLYP